MSGDTPAAAVRRTERCRECQRLFTYTPKADEPTRTLCGGRPCHARANWTADDWAGRARMAEARRDAGAALDAIDHEAIARTRETAA